MFALAAIMVGLSLLSCGSNNSPAAPTNGTIVVNNSTTSDVITCFYVQPVNGPISSDEIPDGEEVTPGNSFTLNNVSTGQCNLSAVGYNRASNNAGVMWGPTLVTISTGNTFTWNLGN